MTPQKARRVVDLIRGKQAQEALAILKFAPQAASETVYKLVAVGIANAESRPTRRSTGEQARHQRRPTSTRARR